jgi:hypothetical protein
VNERILLAVVVLAATWLAAGSAAAICPTAGAIGSTPGFTNCTDPNGNTCMIASPINVDNGCTLDFGNRAVFLAARLRIGAGIVTIRARNFTIQSGGLIQGVGTNTNGNTGGMISIRATGTFSILGSGRSTCPEPTRGA